MTKTSVAIVGAGPAGLTLARILHQSQVPFVVFEREGSSGSRSQGGSLDLHVESGLYALEQCGLRSQFDKFARPEGDTMKVLDKHAVVHFDDADQDKVGAGRPEIDRAHLRSILLESIPESSVQWGHKLSSVVETAPSSYQLQFDNREFYDADIVVGCEGTWSKIRRLLSPEVPVYTGFTYCEFVLNKVSRYPELQKLVGLGLALSLSDNRGIFAQTNSNDVVRSYTVLRVPETWNELENKDISSVEQFIQTYYPDWDSRFLDLIRKADLSSIETRRIYRIVADKLGFLRSSGQYRCVCAIGDAAHVMTPSGEGVNLAMLDAVELAQVIVKSMKEERNLDQWDLSLKAFEQKMFERAAKEESDGSVMMDFMINVNSPQSFVEFFTEMMNALQESENGEFDKAHE